LEKIIELFYFPVSVSRMVKICYPEDGETRDMVEVNDTDLADLEPGKFVNGQILTFGMNILKYETLPVIEE
jgi:hypothetical protein